MNYHTKQTNNSSTKSIVSTNQNFLQQNLSNLKCRTKT